MSNSLDPDQARHSVGPHLVPNCLQKLSADDTGRQRLKAGSKFENVLCCKRSLGLRGLIYMFAVIQ